MAECPMCEGKGTVPAVGESSPYSHIKTCDRCGGSGVVSEDGSTKVGTSGCPTALLFISGYIALAATIYSYLSS